MNTTELKRQRGRPSNFDRDEALEKALQVFWARGYEGASMTELTDALGINRPSIYAAFGNKEELFRKALGKYLQGPISYIGEAMKQPTAKQSIEMFLSKSAEMLTTPGNPKGCMVVQGALSCGEGSESIHQELINHRQYYENAIKLRLELAKAQSELPQDFNSAVMAKYVSTIHQGMSVQATSGASTQELLAIVKLALKDWPKQI